MAKSGAVNGSEAEVRRKTDHNSNTLDSNQVKERRKKKKKKKKKKK